MSKSNKQNPLIDISGYSLVSQNRLAEKSKYPKISGSLSATKDNDKKPTKTKSSRNKKILKPGKDFYEKIGYDVSKLKGDLIDLRLLEKILSANDAEDSD